MIIDFGCYLAGLQVFGILYTSSADLTFKFVINGYIFYDFFDMKGSIKNK